MRPDIIESYEEFNGTNTFEPIKLCGAIHDPSTYSTERHGILSAVIRYKTPFIVNGRAITLDFALGKDISVNSILGFPAITELQLEMRFRPWPHISTSILERVFKVEYREAACGSMSESTTSSGFPSMTLTSNDSLESSHDNVESSSISPDVKLPPAPSDTQPLPPSPAVK
jgi:hypothetical protein